MKFKTGNDLYRFVLPHAIACISNYQKARPEDVMKGISEVILVNGERFTVDGGAEFLFGELLKEIKIYVKTSQGLAMIKLEPD